MKIKEIPLLVFCIFVIRLLVKTVNWLSKSASNPTPKNIAQGTELIVEAVVPWEIGILNWMVGLGTIGAILIICFVLFLKWIRGKNFS